jgi:hypothetical protein
VIAAVAIVFASVGMVLGANLQLPKFFTPNSEDQVSNVDVLRANIKSYYGDPNASTGSSGTGGWTHTLNASSPYAAEAESVASSAWAYLKGKVGKFDNPAVVFDVDDTTLTTWNYELFSNWDFNPGTNANFVGTDGTGCPNSCTFTGNLFPATPGMLDLLTNIDDAGFSIFFITGRGDAQHKITIANLENDIAAGFSDLGPNVTYSGASVPEFDVNYPAPTGLDSGHGSAMNGGSTFADGLFTKPVVGDYPSYLTTTGFCSGTASCPTIQYKSGTRAYIQSQGYHIVANFGDQFSDLLGGYSDTTWKMPNPNYYLP